MDYKKQAHSVYLCTYHVVFVTKYRRPCISDEIGDAIKEYCAYLTELQHGTLISAETDLDHVHLLVELPPSMAPAAMVKILKTMTSKMCHQKFAPEIQQYLYGEDTPLWTSSYFLATTGGVVMDRIREYINSQRTDDHKRKYDKTGKYSKKKK